MLQNTVNLETFYKAKNTQTKRTFNELLPKQEWP